MESECEGFPLIYKWHIGWARPTVRTLKTRGGMLGFGHGLDRGNELAQGQRDLVDLVGGGVPACRLSRARREGCESCFRASDGRAFGR